MPQETKDAGRLPDARRWRDFVLPILLVLVAAAAVLENLVFSGDMRWHATQPAVVQGGAEALLLGALAMFCAWRARGATWAVLAVAVFLYARRHHVDLPLVCALLTAETLVSIGLGVLRNGTSDHPGWQLTKAFCAGACVWWLLMLVLHGVHQAYSATMLWLFAAIALVSAIARRRSVLLMPALRAFAGQTPWQRAVYALIGVCFLVQFARSNAVIGFDTLWYLARGQQVLSPNGSLFEPLGLVSAVHYAPKLFETWLLPFEAAGDLSFQFAQTQLFVIAGGCLVVGLFARAGMPQAWRPLALLVLLTLPAIAATALQLKNDLLAWYFVLLGITAACRWFEHRRFGDLCWVFIASALACSTKLTVLPMVAALWMVLLIEATLRRRSFSFAWRHEPGDLMTLGLTVSVSGALLYRTWSLSGLPTIGPEPLVGIWQWLGFELRPPAGTLNWLWPQDWSTAATLLPEALFRPDAMTKLRIAWTGNVWLLCGSLALYWQRSAEPASSEHQRIRWLLWPLVFLGLVLLIAWRYDTRGGDGNYYLIPVTAACVLGFGAAARVASTRMQQAGLATVFVITLGVHVTLAFLSAGWSRPGTRAFDMDFAQTVFDTRSRLSADRAAAGLQEVHGLLAQMPAATRTLVVGPSPAAHLLPTRVEALEHVAFSRPEYIAGGAHFRDYLRVSGIDCIVVDKRDRPDVYRLLLLALNDVPHESLWDSDRWRVFVLKRRDED